MCPNASKCFHFIFGFTALNKWKYLSNICHFCCITNSSSCTAPSLTLCTFWQHSVGGMVPKKNADVFRFLFDA